jgi:hypothetical protein
MFMCNQEISALATDNETLCMISPDFDNIVGVSKSQIRTKGKPLAVIDHLETRGVPMDVETLVRRLYASVTHGAPSSTVKDSS